jgi:hypothetical protein
MQEQLNQLLSTGEEIHEGFSVLLLASKMEFVSRKWSVSRDILKMP